MSGGVPAGWVLVPVEPTDEQIKAGIRSQSGSHEGRPVWKCAVDVQARASYAAMLAAAPAPPSRDADVERDAAEAAIAAMRWTDPRMVEDGKRCLAGQRFASFGFGGECFLTASQVEALGRCYDGARAALQALGERG